MAQCVVQAAHAASTSTVTIDFKGRTPLRLSHSAPVATSDPPTPCNCVSRLAIDFLGYQPCCDNRDHLKAGFGFSEIAAVAFARASASSRLLVSAVARPAAFARDTTLLVVGDCDSVTEAARRDLPSSSSRPPVGFSSEPTLTIIDHRGRPLHSSSRLPRLIHSHIPCRKRCFLANKSTGSPLTRIARSGQETTTVFAAARAFPGEGPT